jgi:hypothetical protein
MKRRITIELDRVLREDQLAHLAETAISRGLAEAAAREKGYQEGRRSREKRSKPEPLATILDDLGMTLPAAATSLLQEEQAAHRLKKKPAAASRPAREVPSKRSMTSKKS